MAEKKEPAEKTAKKKAPAEKAAKAPAGKKEAPAAQKREPGRVLVQYREEVVPYLMKKFGYKTVMQVPKLEKIVINTGLGDIKDNQKSMQIIENELKLITGQKPIYCKSLCAATGCTTFSISSSPSLFPACATSAACRQRHSTAEGTMR